MTSTPSNASNRPDPTRIILNEKIGFEELIGQVDAIEKLKAFGDLYQARNEAPEHILLLGPSGMGKRTIARAFAKRYLVGLREVEASRIQRTGDMTAILTSLEVKEGFSIVDIQGLRAPIAPVLSEALEHYTIQLEIGKGVGARITQLYLSRFTCIATAPQEADLPAALLKHFSLRVSLRRYSTAELESISVQRARNYNLNITPGVASLIVSACEGTPAGVDSLIRRLTRLGKGSLNEQEVLQMLSAFGLKIPRSGTTGDETNLDKLTGSSLEGRDSTASSYGI